MPRSSVFFPRSQRKSLYCEIEPRKYSTTLKPFGLIQSFMIAYVCRLSGLRAVAERCNHLVGTSNFSSLSHAVKRDSNLSLVQHLVGTVESTHEPGRDELVAVDGMAVTLPKTQRHNCKKFNSKTVGGGVVWTYTVDAVAGCSPVKILQTVQGAWHDSKVMRAVTLIPHGPVYLMDRGFYALEVVQKWLEEKVRFIVRVKSGGLKYKVLRHVSSARKIDGKQIVLDAVVRLGGPRAKAHPVVRFLIARLPSGEELILATDQLNWSTQRVLAAYKKRWHIERFHRFLKDALGLAHLYSFDQNGMMFLLYTALLTALLLFFAATDAAGEAIQIFRRMLTMLHSRLGMGIPWKRNTYTPRRGKKNAGGKTRKNL